MKRVPEAILEAIESVRLPSMPQVLLRFLHLVEDDHTSMTQLADLVGQDPALSARMLTVANSAALRQRSEIKNLEQCLVALGTRLARTIASCLAVQSVFASTAQERECDLRGFWKHSLYVAEIAREISDTIGRDDSEEAYLAALMHDVGELLLLGGMGRGYETVLCMSRDEVTLEENERALLGADHAQVGAWLMDQWQLSSFMADAVLFHHRESLEIASADPLSQVVWSAHVIAEPDREPSAELTAAQALLGLTPEIVEEIRSRAGEAVAVLAEALGIAVGPEVRTLPTLPAAPAAKRRATHHDRARSGIVAAVRDMAMMEPLQQNLSGLADEGEILLAVRESARIIFGLGRLAFFLVDPDKPVLRGARVAGQAELLQRLEIPLVSGMSLAATVTLGEQAQATFEEERAQKPSLVDQQVIRALQTEGVLYVPMRARDQRIGLMAYGVSGSQLARVKKHLDWITTFGHSAAESLQSWRTMRGREASAASEAAALFEQKARKIVHEAGNPLGIIRNYLKIVRQRLPDQSMAEEMDILREEVDRVAQILRQLNDRGGASGKAATPLELNAVIEGMLALYGDSLFKSREIVCTKNLDPELPKIDADRDSVKQILLNLWKNGSEALRPGDRLNVATLDRVPGRPEWVELRISDTGPGLPADVMQGLFRPLDPNRREGHSGLGISIVAELVQRLKGEIRCESRPETGTTFVILLPRVGRDGE